MLAIPHRLSISQTLFSLFLVFFFLFSLSLYSSFFLQHKASISSFFLSFFSNSSETNFSRNKLFNSNNTHKLFNSNNLQNLDPPLCFSPKSLTHKLFNSNRVGPMVQRARLGSESISNSESFQRENCWSVQLRSIQRVLLRRRWMIGLADMIVIVNSQAQPSSSSEQSH